jgi:hypothetical protein
MSAKILGSDTELNMWQQEMNHGHLIPQAPREVLERKEEMLGLLAKRENSTPES